MLRKKSCARDVVNDTVPTSDTGAIEALEQVANWVRFSDTKATVLTAGFGVVLTALVSNWRTVTTASNLGGVGAGVLIGIVIASFIAGLLTLYWLILAIAPRSTRSDPRLNRFAWPSLARTTAAEIAQHAKTVPVAEDAWRQAVRLAVIAERKFRFTGFAVWSFASFVILGFASVTLAVTLTVTLSS